MDYNELTPEQRAALMSRYRPDLMVTPRSEVLQSAAPRSEVLQLEDIQVPGDPPGLTPATIEQGVPWKSIEVPPAEVEESISSIPPTLDPSIESEEDMLNRLTQEQLADPTISNKERLLQLDAESGALVKAEQDNLKQQQNIINTNSKEEFEKSKFIAKEQERVDEEKAKEIEAQNTLTSQMLGDVQTQKEKLLAEPVEGYWARASTGEKIITGLALILGSYAQGSGATENNPVADAISANVAQDILEQKRLLDRKFDVLSDKALTIEQKNKYELERIAAKGAISEAAITRTKTLIEAARVKVKSDIQSQVLDGLSIKLDEGLNRDRSNTQQDIITAAADAAHKKKLNPMSTSFLESSGTAAAKTQERVGILSSALGQLKDSSISPEDKQRLSISIIKTLVGDAVGDQEFNRNTGELTATGAKAITSVMEGLLKGAGGGAIVGSAIPVIGTAIGAVGGGLAGLGAGLTQAYSDLQVNGWQNKADVDKFARKVELFSESLKKGLDTNARIGALVSKGAPLDKAMKAVNDRNALEEKKKAYDLIKANMGRGKAK